MPIIPVREYPGPPVDASRTTVRRRPGPVPRLTRQQVVDAVRNKHADQLTMRAVATTLGVSTAGLYRYFPDREALLAAVAEDVAGSVVLPPADQDWRQWLQNLTIVVRDMLVQHPCLLDPEVWGLVSATGQRIVDAAFELLTSAGFDDLGALNAYGLVSRLAYSSASYSLMSSREFSPALARNHAAWQAAASPHIRRFNAIAATADPEEQFRTQTAWAIAGIPNPLPKSRRRRVTA